MRTCYTTFLLQRVVSHRIMRCARTPTSCVELSSAGLRASPAAGAEEGEGDSFPWWIILAAAVLAALCCSCLAAAAMRYRRNRSKSPEFDTPLSEGLAKEDEGVVLLVRVTATPPPPSLISPSHRHPQPPHHRSQVRTRRPTPTTQATSRSSQRPSSSRRLWFPSPWPRP